MLSGWRWLYKPQVGGIPVVRRGIDWETIVIVSGLSVLLMRGTISDPETGYLLPRVMSTLRTPGWRFHIVRGRIKQGTTVIVPSLLKLYMYGRISNPGMGPYILRVTLAHRKQSCDYHTVRAGIDPGNHCFRPPSYWG